MKRPQKLLIVLMDTAWAIIYVFGLMVISYVFSQGLAAIIINEMP